MVRSKCGLLPPSAIRHLVSILVLLDGALEVERVQAVYTEEMRFNPCSIGWCARSSRGIAIGTSANSFNPCSIGWCARRQRPHELHRPCSQVSILVLLDGALEGYLGGLQYEL